jgi:hypothetical protein
VLICGFVMADDAFKLYDDPKKAKKIWEDYTSDPSELTSMVAALAARNTLTSATGLDIALDALLKSRSPGDSSKRGGLHRKRTVF